MPRVSAKVLSDLFDSHNIHDRSSLQAIESWGGLGGLSQMLDTDLKNGIRGDDNDTRIRAKLWGNNDPIVKEPTTLWELITEALEDKMLRILIAAAFISLVIGVVEEGWEEGWIEGFAIFVAVITIVCVTAGNNYMKEKQFRKLNEQAESRNINVIRGGQVFPINIYRLVVGDIVQIVTGEILPVDGVVVTSNKILSDESSITGESDPILKNPPIDFNNPKLNCFLISGSKIIDGSGTMVVLAVGRHTQWGKIKETLQQDSDATPLQEKLAILADDIGNVGMYAAIGTFAAMTIHLFVEILLDGESIFTIEVLDAILEHFIIAVTIIVVAVPEGLPLAVTISLAYSVGKMKEEQNLVRFLAACETMGGANNICSDKTGTLTKNLMQVTRFYAYEHTFKNDQNDNEFKQENFNKNAEFLDWLCQGLCVNSSAFPKLVTKSFGGSEQIQFEQNGNKTECALIEFAYLLGYDYKKYRPSDRIQQTFEFSSAKKKMTTIWEVDQSTSRVFCKGAADFILDNCTHYIDADGVKRQINEQFKTKLQATIKEYACQSLRTLLITYNDIPNKHTNDYGEQEEVEKELCILGLAGIKDPLRKEIVNAVKTCRTAGVTVRMVTGDILDTAVAISKEAGILPGNFDLARNEYYVMEGKKFRQEVDGLKKVKNAEGVEEPQVGNLEKFKKISEQLRVLARSAPEDKYLLVVGLKQLGHVVAVTGDGTNDAPALKKADVGFAMGIAGTEVAKEAAGIILLNDNFASIVTAMKWGRNIFESIRKFLQFQLTINCVALSMTFIGGITYRVSPLNSIQMLWVNLIMDTMASLALATEPPSDELLKRRPYGRTEYIITPIMWRNIICQALFQLTVLNFILFYGDEFFGVPSQIGIESWTIENGKHFTIFFSTFVFMQVFNEINARKLKKDEINVFEGFFNNPLFLFIWVGTIIVHFMLVELGGRAIQCSPLTIKQHLITLGIGSISLIIGIFIKLIPESIFDSIQLFKVQQKVDPSEENLFRNPTLLRKRSSFAASNTQGSNSRKDSLSRGKIGSKDYSKKNF